MKRPPIGGSCLVLENRVAESDAIEHFLEEAEVDVGGLLILFQSLTLAGATEAPFTISVDPELKGIRARVVVNLRHLVLLHIVPSFLPS